MTWTRPEAWGLLALALPIAVLHLRWRRRHDAEVSSLTIWRAVAAAHAARRGFRRIEEAAQLAALLVALAAFTAALAGPVIGRAPDAARRLAIVLDVSASMNTRTPGGTRFSDAVAAAEQAVARLGPGDEVLVWTASAHPEVAVAPTTDHTAARAALRALRPSLDVSGIAETLDLARFAAGDARRSSILVLTDAVGDARLRGGRADGVSVGVVGGESVSNAGIVDVRIDADGSLRVRVAPTDGEPSARAVVLTRDGVEVARRDVEALATGEADTTFERDVVGAAGGGVEVRLDPADDFAPDDVAEIVLPAPRKVRVVVVAPGLAPSPYLAAALRAMGDALDRDATVAQPDAPPDVYAAADVVIADGCVPASAPRDRPTVVFGAPGRRVERPLLWGAAAHPVLEGADLAPLRVDHVSVLEPVAGERPIVECAEGVVAVAGVSGGVRRVRFGFVPGATTLPLEPAFPLLVRNAIVWVVPRPMLPPALRAGEPIATSEPLPPVDRVWATGPGDVAPRPLLVRDGAIVEVAPLPPPGGPRRMSVRGLPGEETTAVNWFAPAGFRLAPERHSFPAAAAVVGALADRRGNTDTRVALAGWCAIAGALALGTGLALSFSPAPVRPAAAQA